ncbi:tripartite tricarboxylate transporter substrate binding protein [Fodinicurvata sp. EGI_FJ10296]|uniref:Bug family tripartite tricarboxylate transporter substrate binding protein n=1 Tax=Fodinicurvata sp. EGI_FJ10296 TaxID=3231908 RepID=UPI003454B4C0
MTNRLYILAAALSAGVAGPALIAGQVQAQEYEWQPDEPVTIIVPWAAGGSTDTVTRVLANELEQAIGQSFVVNNQPGASGSVGSRSVWEADHDGMMIAAGAAADLGAYPVLDMLDVTLDEWRLYLHIANVSVISVHPDSEYEDFGDLMAAWEENPGEITVSTAGVSSAGHIAISAIGSAADIEYRHVTYDGGNPAVIAAVSGEVDVTSQLASEQAEMIRGNRLKPLAVVAARPLEIEGYGEIPSITDWLPDIEAANNYFGIFVPADAPEEVLNTLDRVWEEEIANSEALAEYAADSGAVFDPSYGEAAQEAVMPMLRINACQLFEGGQAANDPADFGIECN